MKKLVTLAVLLISLFAFTTMATAKTVKVPSQFKTIQAAIKSTLVKSGDTIVVAAGDYAGAKFVTDKQLTIKGAGANLTIITSGPALFGANAGFYFSGLGAGTVIQDMGFEVAFPVYSAEPTNGIVVKNCKMTQPVQGVTNWGGSNWSVVGNAIRNLKTLKTSGVDAAGGIGVLIGTRFGAVSVAKNNAVIKNQITGTVAISSGAVPSAVGGIALYADLREGTAGPVILNQVKGNTLSLTKQAGIKNIHGIGLNEATPTPPAKHLIKNNTVVNNVFPLPVNKMPRVECYPPELKDVNNITVPQTLTMEEVVATDANFNPL